MLISMIQKDSRKNINEAVILKYPFLKPSFSCDIFTSTFVTPGLQIVTIFFTVFGTNFYDNECN